MVKYPHKSKRMLTYHGRSGYPLIHKDTKSGRTYIMVRARGGGTKRIYLENGWVPKRYREKK